jgi:hypothetical protein
VTKKPKIKHPFITEKIPKAQPDSNPYRLNPAWRVKRLEMVDPFGWHNMTSEQIHEIRVKLSNFETMTWGEIIGPQNHPIGVGDICKEARDRLSAMMLDDVDELFSLRLMGTQRIWGILEHNVLTVLWWDPNHQICPSPKKYT